MSSVTPTPPAMSSRHVRPAERAAMQQCLTAAAPYRQLHAEQTISSWNEGSKGIESTLVAWLWNLQAYNPIQLIFNFAYIQRLYFYSDSTEGHSLKGLRSELARTYQMLHRGTFKHLASPHGVSLVTHHDAQVQNKSDLGYLHIFCISWINKNSNTSAQVASTS